MHLSRTYSDIQYVDFETLLAESEDALVAAVHFMSARYMGASLSLEVRRGTQRGSVLWPWRDRSRALAWHPDRGATCL
eukprot:2548965-Pyramimonas_sp.AAC.1